MRFAVEMSSANLAEYAKVHVAGCMNLKDPEPFEVSLSRKTPSKIRRDINEAVEVMTGWDQDDFVLSPCVKKVLKEG